MGRTVQLAKVLGAVVLATVTIDLATRADSLSRKAREWRASRRFESYQRLAKELQAARKSPKEYEGFLIGALDTQVRYGALDLIGEMSQPSERVIRALVVRKDRLPTVNALGRIGPEAVGALPFLPKGPYSNPIWAEAIERMHGGQLAGVSRVEENFRHAHEKAGTVAIAGWQGVLSRVGRKHGQLIADDESWLRTWRLHAGPATPPSVDFRRNAVIAYFHGRSNSTLRLHLETSTNHNGDLEAVFSFTESDCHSEPAEYPYIFAVIPRQSRRVVVKERWDVAMAVEPGIKERMLGTFTLDDKRL